jgi:peptidoglycan/LPS O-acetylase OafA/YrhL
MASINLSLGRSVELSRPMSDVSPTSNKASPPWAYRPEIDGLRAFAVLAVILGHAGLSFTDGFVGVDVFFVISGYLIASIILREVERGQFSLLGFWERRLRRIMPAALLMVVVVLAVGWAIMPPRYLGSLGSAALAQVLLLANVYYLHDIGYFATDAVLKPLLHTWSLAVEEQFYLVMPILLVWAYRRSRAFAWRLFVVLTAMSLAGNIWGVVHAQASAYYLLFGRAWELLAGLLLALVRQDKLGDAC